MVMDGAQEREVALCHAHACTAAPLVVRSLGFLVHGMEVVASFLAALFGGVVGGNFPR